MMGHLVPNPISALLYARWRSEQKMASKWSSLYRSPISFDCWMPRGESSTSLWPDASSASLSKVVPWASKMMVVMRIRVAFLEGFSIYQFLPELFFYHS